jgi:hypothetical protein
MSYERKMKNQVWGNTYKTKTFTSYNTSLLNDTVLRKVYHQTINGHIEKRKVPDKQFGPLQVITRASSMTPYFEKCTTKLSTVILKKGRFPTNNLVHLVSFWATARPGFAAGAASVSGAKVLETEPLNMNTDIFVFYGSPKWFLGASKSAD